MIPIKNVWLIRLSLLVTSLLLSLVCMEIGLRAYFHFRTNYDIEMWKYSTHMKSTTSDARSHIHVPLQDERLMSVDVHINSKGLRDREFDYAKSPGVHRVLCLGDSVTFGWGVSLEETFVKRLEREFGPGTEFLNLGVGNYNTEQELAAYLLEGRKYHPDAVLLFYHISDAEPTQRHVTSFLKNHSYTYVFLIQKYYQLRPFFFKNANYISFYQKLYEESHFAPMRGIFRELKDATSGDHVPLIVVIQPEMRKLRDYPFENYHHVVSAAFEDLKVPVIDLLAAFQGLDSQSLVVARDDPHPNSRAHEITANYVSRQLRERKLLEWIH